MNLFKKYNLDLNDELVINALTHTSYANEHGTVSYERLEFLGDAILEIVTSDYLFKQTSLSEGSMSKLRSLYVCENALYEYSKLFDLKNFIKLGNGISVANKTIIADVFESIIAVIYLKYGLDRVRNLFDEVIVPHIKNNDDFLMDYKSLLQESVQTVKRSVRYEIVDETGPAHNKRFKVNVVIDGLVYGTGVGSSKKEAEQNAAKEAYHKNAKF